MESPEAGDKDLAALQDFLYRVERERGQSLGAAMPYYETLTQDRDAVRRRRRERRWPSSYQKMRPSADPPYRWLTALRAVSTGPPLPWQ
jgi:hypothetical protein